MNRREFFRSLFGGTVAVAVSVTALLPQQVFAAFQPVKISSLSYDTFVERVGTVLKYHMFEFNDETTRQLISQQVSILAKQCEEIYDFRVVCNERNNTPEVIDRNELKLTVSIKKDRSLKWTDLNFETARTTVSWNEVKA